ncbi:MAG: hypothetical protein EOM18_05480 [Clostridia bacterium]|nr:hypothetical protein [Clostridia bacterium]
MKRRLWYGAVIFLVLFLGMPIKAMLELESVSEINDRCADAAQRIEETGAVRRMFDTYVCGGDFLLFFMIVGAALLGAWSGLYWLHSKKKMDMLGSLPLKRGKLFLVSSVNTFVLFAVPFLVNMILLVLVGASKGILSGDTFGYVIEGIGVGVLFFAVHYLCAALAMLLTGKLITGILGTMVFLSIIPIIHGVLESYPSIFWKTYVESNLFENAARYFESPTMAYLYTVESLENLDSLFSKNSSAWLLFVSAFLMLVIFAGVCMWLIKIRPSEGAEKAMVFPKTEGIIKAVILFALSMGGGIFFMSIGRARGEGEHGGFWFWFGLIFVWILGSILIEVIYSFDRKKIFDHKIWTGAAGLVVLGVAVFFSFDLSGYDKWIPSQDEVAHATADAEVRYVTYPDGSGNSLEFMENHLSEFTGTAVFKLSENGVQNVNAEEDEDGEWTYVTVLYQMKNGSVKKRTYPVDREIVLETQQELYKEKAYKEAMFPIALSKPEDVEPGYLRFMGRACRWKISVRTSKKNFSDCISRSLPSLPISRSMRWEAEA